jgi:hypothetical protein
LGASEVFRIARLQRILERPPPSQGNRKIVLRSNGCPP